MYNDTEHVILMQMKISVPDGLYIPVDNPLTDKEREEIGSDSLCAATEVRMFIVEQLKSLGVEINFVGIQEHFTPDK